MKEKLEIVALDDPQAQESFLELACFLNPPFDLLLQDGDDKKKPKPPQLPQQKCGDTFRTRGKTKIEVKGKLNAVQALLIIADAYGKAEQKAKFFCQSLSPKDCQNLQFVKYDLFDSDVDMKGGKTTVEVELVIVWKCVK